MFGEFLKVIIFNFKPCHLVRNGRFSGQNQVQNDEIRKFNNTYSALKFLKN